MTTHTVISPTLEQKLMGYDGVPDGIPNDDETLSKILTDLGFSIEKYDDEFGLIFTNILGRSVCVKTHPEITEGYIKFEYKNTSFCRSISSVYINLIAAEVLPNDPEAYFETDLPSNMNDLLENLAQKFLNQKFLNQNNKIEFSNIRFRGESGHKEIFMINHEDESMISIVLTILTYYDPYIGKIRTKYCDVSVPHKLEESPTMFYACYNLKDLYEKIGELVL